MPRLDARLGWVVLVFIVIVWDVAAALNNTDSLTSVFRRGVAETWWRWPVLAVTLFLLVHLFSPPSFRKYDPIDRLYYRLNPVTSDNPDLYVERPQGPVPPSGPTPRG